jgi:hypothetical protein
MAWVTIPLVESDDDFHFISELKKENKFSAVKVNMENVLAKSIEWDIRTPLICVG